MMVETSRDRILRAAREVAKEAGASHLSLDAIASRAGLSKGGLLYNFPSKTKLLQALVADHVDSLDSALSKAEHSRMGSANSAALAYLDVFETEAKELEPPPSGMLAAIAEDPSLLDPVRSHIRALLDRLTCDSDPTAALIAFLAVEGLRLGALFGTDRMSDAEREGVMVRLRGMLEG